MNRAGIINICVAASILMLASCIRPPDFSDVPSITFMNQSRDTLLQQTDSLLITFSFTDGDGDLGNADSVLNLFIKDLRDSFVESKRIPFIPTQGANNGISGEITITLPPTCCLYPDGSAPCFPHPSFPTNQLVYEIYIKDRADHESNKITTRAINLICN